MSYWKAKDIQYARALQNHRDWESPKALLRMRHMAKAGATAQEIADVLGWDVEHWTIKRRLKKYNIVVPFSRAKHTQQYRVTGQEPYLARPMRDTDQKAYRPKNMRSA